LEISSEINGSKKLFLRVLESKLKKQGKKEGVPNIPKITKITKK